MSEPCNVEFSQYELLGRILYESAQINRIGKVKERALYPKLKADEEKGREGFFTNKISVVRICRAQSSYNINWDDHVAVARSFVANSNLAFRGFLLSRVKNILHEGLKVEMAASRKNPYHAHIVIPEYNEPIRPKDGLVISDVLPGKIKSILDRLRKSMMPPLILSPSHQYTCPSITIPPCHGCINL